MKASLKGKKDVLDRIITKLKASRPKKDELGTFDISRTSSSVMAGVKYVLTTGIDAFDSMTGGLPFGRVVEFYGLDQSGKTGMAIRAAIRAQQRHVYERIQDGDRQVAVVGDGVHQRNEPACALRQIDDTCDVTVFYIDNEGSLAEDDKLWLSDEYNPGDPPVRLDVADVMADTIFQMFKIIDRTVELLAEEEKESGRTQFLVVVVDTIASTSTAEEISGEWGKVDYQRQPKQLREGFRRMIREINRHNVCMICVNQVSEKYQQQKVRRAGRQVTFSTPQDEDFSTFGGRALKYYASLRVFFYKIGTVKLDPKKFPDGLLIGFKTTKNRIVKPLREGRLALIFDYGYKDSLSKLETLLFLQYASYGKKGIFFRFRSAGVEPVTFKSAIENRDVGEEEDERGSPAISAKSEWLPFYLAHKQDFDAMWEEAIRRSFSIDSSGSQVVVDLRGDEIDENEISDGEVGG